jgi:hypothetical protein
VGQPLGRLLRGVFTGAKLWRLFGYHHRVTTEDIAAITQAEDGDLCESLSPARADSSDQRWSLP